MVRQDRDLTIGAEMVASEFPPGLANQESRCLAASIASAYRTATGISNGTSDRRNQLSARQVATLKPINIPLDEGPGRCRLGLHFHAHFGRASADYSHQELGPTSVLNP